MIDADLILQPLGDVGDAVHQLTDYETSEQLRAALERVWDALERSLRRLLRADTATPDAQRLAAFSPAEFPLPRLVETLRAHDLISLELAGLIHESAHAVQRARAGEVRAADADAMRRATARLREQVRSLEQRPMPGTPLPPPSARVPEESPAAEPEPEPAPRDRSFGRLAAIVAVLLLVGLGIVLVLSLERAMDAAVEAFRDGRFEVAAERFRNVVQDDPSNVTARLYLARIYRRAGEHDRAAEELQTAVREEPADPDVRRELGHLLLELNRPDAAARQYRRAVELEPEQSLAWLGLVRALRAAGDPTADQVLARAPADVRAVLAEQGRAAPAGTPAATDPGSGAPTATDPGSG